MGLKSLVKWLTPLGLIESHRLRFRMGRLGLPATPATAAAVDACRYELWPEFLRAGSAPWTLVDVGANEGAFIDAVARLATLKKVYAFEPLPACRSSLETVLRRIPNSKLFSAAVGSRSGEIEINFTGDSSMSSVLTPEARVSSDYQAGDFDIRQRLKVPLTTLDESLPENEPIDLLKIDVQGFEMEVFRGAALSLKRTRALLLEVNYVAHYQGGSTFDELCGVVRAAGFRTFGISSPYSGSNGPLWADALFVRNA